MNTGLLLTAAIAGGGAVLVLLVLLVATALDIDGFRGEWRRQSEPEPTPGTLAQPVRVTSVRLDLAPAGELAHQEVAS